MFYFDEDSFIERVMLVLWRWIKVSFILAVILAITKVIAPYVPTLAITLLK